MYPLIIDSFIRRALGDTPDQLLVPARSAPVLSSSTRSYGSAAVAATAASSSSTAHPGLMTARGGA
jgi:hypothetical protein